MTIHELLQAVGLTANDEIPIWDVDGTGEPTKKITAQQLAQAVVTLANLVSGVKGDKESTYRHGDVNLTPANIGAKPTQTAVADPTASGTAVAFIASITQNANGVITPTKKTVRSASQSESGLMSATDKAKLDGIAAGAQVNSLTGVKGNAESSYRTGNVNLTPANIGAAAADTHRYKFYTSPNQLGLSGDKTVLEIFNALPDESVIVTASNLKASDMPNSSTMGELMIWRQSASRSHIVFYGKVSSVGTYRMYLGASSYNGNNNNAPDGVWHRVYDGTAVVPVPAGGTGAANAADARANLGITPANVGASISLTSSAPTNALLYNALKGLELNYPANIRVNQVSLRMLTGKNNLYGGYGTVLKTGVESGTLALAFDICALVGNTSAERYSFAIRLSESTITHYNVYKYTGTAV